MLEIATINGAHVAGLESRTGSLTPGKKADVVLIDARQLNVAPVIDPVAAVTLSADVSNVDTVIVDGVVRKRDGKLLADVGRARQLVEQASEYLVGEAARRKTA
jgi:cytosine/adenosine deaminase-related metal-dependent hydrolase